MTNTQPAVNSNELLDCPQPELINVRHMECCDCTHFWMERGCVISGKCKECGSRCVRTVEAYQEAV